MATTPRPTPKAPDDSFKGAEASIELQKRNALAVGAEYGRRGLEAIARGGVDLTSRVNAVNGAFKAIANDFNVPAGMRDQMAGSIRKGFTPAIDYTRSADRNLRREAAAAAQAQTTYFNQAREAVPMYRSENEELTETYRQAYEERQAKIRAEAEQRAEARRQFELGLAAQVEARQLAAQQHAATMAAQQQMHAASMSSQARIAAAQMAALQSQAAPTSAPPPYRPATRTVGRLDNPSGRTFRPSWRR